MTAPVDEVTEDSPFATVFVVASCRNGRAWAVFRTYEEATAFVKNRHLDYKQREVLCTLRYCPQAYFDGPDGPEVVISTAPLLTAIEREFWSRRPPRLKWVLAVVLALVILATMAATGSVLIYRQIQERSAAQRVAEYTVLRAWLKQRAATIEAEHPPFKTDGKRRLTERESDDLKAFNESHRFRLKRPCFEANGWSSDQTRALGGVEFSRLMPGSNWLVYEVYGPYPYNNAKGPLRFKCVVIDDGGGKPCVWNPGRKAR